MVLPWRPNSWNYFPCLALLRIVSGWNTTLSTRWQLSSHICDCEGKPNSPQALTGNWTVYPRSPDRCTGVLESSRTLKNVWMCCHDVRTYANFELFEASWHWWESRWYCHFFWTDVADWWVSERFTGSSRRKHGIRLLWFGIYTESSLNTWNCLLEACDTDLIIIRLFPSLEK